MSWREYRQGLEEREYRLEERREYRLEEREYRLVVVELCRLKDWVLPGTS